MTAALTGAVSAQEATTTEPTPTPTDTETAELVVDSEVIVTDWRYNNGRFVITFQSEVYREVSLIAMPSQASSGSGSGSVNYRGRYLQPDAKTTVTIPVPSTGGEARVWISTAKSLDAGKIHYLRADTGSSLIDGPFTGRDVAIAVLAASLVIGAVVLLRVVYTKMAAELQGERLA